MAFHWHIWSPSKNFQQTKSLYIIFFKRHQQYYTCKQRYQAGLVKLLSISTDKIHWSNGLWRAITILHLWVCISSWHGSRVNSSVIFEWGKYSSVSVSYQQTLLQRGPCWLKENLLWWLLSSQLKLPLMAALASFWSWHNL